MKILPQIKDITLNPFLEEKANILINGTLSLVYEASNNFNFEILEDLIENKAYATALLYLNEYCSINIKNSDILEESNINNFFEDCEELLSQNIEIVEEVGIPLTDINGYKIFEGEGYILRGNGKKKIKESFNTEVSSMESLAYDIVDFMEGFDTYDFNDNYGSKEEAFEQTVDSLYNQEDIRNLITYLESIKEEADQESFSMEALESILARLNELVSEPLTEDGEGTQCSDIAPKIDQSLGINKPKRKYNDVLLSDLHEGVNSIINKGFMKNKDGLYQRGNYILVKEGERYLVVHKNKLTESKIQFTNKDVKNYLNLVNNTVGQVIKNTAKAISFEFASTGTLMNDNNAILYEIPILKNNGADLIGICDEIKTQLGFNLDNDYKISKITVSPANNKTTVINIGLFAGQEPIEIN